MTCSHCGKPVDDSAAFCSSCGAPQNKTCPACQQQLAANARFCSSCGFSFNAAEEVDPGIETPPSPVEKPRSKTKKYLLFFLLLLGFGLVFYLFTHMNQEGDIPTSEADTIKSEDASEMAKLMAKEVLDPDNSDPVDFVVGRWMIQDERLRIRKIGDHLYRADDEANDLAYEVTWDGHSYALTKDGQDTLFTIDNFDTLRTADGDEYGYRLTPSGERKVRLTPTALFKDLRDLTIAELEKKYSLESIDFDSQMKTTADHYDMPSFEMGFGASDVVRYYHIKAHGVSLIAQQDISDPLDDSERRRLYNQMGRVKACMWWGPCDVFLSGMPNKMSQKDYNKALFGEDVKHLDDQGSGQYFHQQMYESKGFSVSYAFQDPDLDSNTPLTAKSKVGFWGGRDR